MSDKDALTPRVFVVRHGETEWSKSGRFTSFTEIDLTPEGTTKVSGTAAELVGPGKLIDPHRLACIFASPRVRAKTTLDLLFPPTSAWGVKTISTEAITEWNYGDYEGLTKEEIRLRRKEKGLDEQRKWDVWSDGCEGGESVQQVTDRLDELITRIKDIQRPHMRSESHADVVLVAHGLILRCFVKRWLGYGIPDDLSLMFETGAVGVLRYD